MHYIIKREVAPHLFVEVDTFEGEADTLGLFLHDLQIKDPGRYVAEQVDEIENTAPATKRAKKTKT